MSDQTLFEKLKRLFSTEVVVRNVGGKSLKVIDTDEIQHATDKNSLRDRYNRLHSSTYNLHNRDMSMAYAAARLELFRDYDVMDMDPIIASALDIYADECLVPNEFGYILAIKSENEQIKKILENLFYDVLNIEFNLGSWVRNLSKYGDAFLRLEISPEYGVYMVHPISAYELTRIEGSDPNNLNYVKYQHDGLGGGQEYENFEIAHFRLLSDSNFLPYGKCLAGDTYVDTEFGSVQIKNIKSGDAVWSFNPNTRKMELTSVVRRVSSGIKEILRIRTQHNFIDSSKNHPILTFNPTSKKMEYKVAEDVKVGDLVLISSNKNKKNRETNIDKNVSADTTSRSFVPSSDNIPEYVDEEFANFFGFMLGDGWVKKYNTGCRICFALGTDEAQNNRYINLLEKYSGKKAVITHVGSKTGKSRSATVYTKRFYEILKNLGFGENARTKRIPQWVFESEESIRLSFIDGFYNADGWEFTDAWAKHYAIELCNKDLIYDIKRLVQLSNIKSSIPHSKIFNDIVEICGIECNRTESHSIYYYLDGNLKTQMDKYNFLQSDEFFLEPIKSIECREDAETFDIQVESENSNFIANGIIVHNSMIEPARRIWKQLSLMEDAMLIHRIMRAPEKRIFKVDVGNIPPSEIDGFMEKMMTKLKKVPYIDEKTGDYNLRFNLNNMTEDFFLPVRGGDSGTSIDTLPGMEFTGTEDIEYLRNKMMAALKIPKAFLGYEEGLCLVPETKIRMLDGTHKTILQLINDHKLGKKNYVYSIDPSTNNVVAGEVESAQWTRKNAQLVRVYLDNGEYIDCTPDHNFMARDGSWVEAQNLKSGQSLMPIYTKDEVMYGKSGYEKVYNPGSNSWEWTHRVIDEQINGKRSRNDVIHHADFNRKNNRPDNLHRMDRSAHWKLHADHAYETICSPECNAYKKTQEFRDKKSAERKRFIATHPFEIDRLKGNLAQYTMTTEELSIACKNGWMVSSPNRRQKLTDDNKKYKKGDKLWKSARIARGFLFDLPTIDQIVIHCNKIGKYQTADVAETFGCNRKYVHKLIYQTGYSSIDDFAEQFSNPKNHKVARVEFLNNRRDTCDLTVKTYHNFATSAGVFVHNSGKATLAAEDVRFARTIGRMQRIIVSELTKIAIVHLYVQGYKDASLVDFELSLSNPSTVFEQEKIQIWQDKINLANDMMESKCFSKKWLYSNLWKLSDDDAESIRKEVISDGKDAWRLDQIEKEGNDPKTSKQSAGADGELSGIGGESDTSVSDESPSTGPGEDLPDLPDLKEIDASTTGSVVEEDKERDQTGLKDSDDYPFGEDPLGTKEIHRKERDRPIRTNKLANPLRVNERKLISPRAMEEDLKSIKKTLAARIQMKNGKNVITESKSMLDESNVLSDDETRQ
jgi:intein/homing endonuclease